MENDIIKQFNLPAYAKNRSFADASSQIKRRFKGREDIESKNTEKDLLDRLRQAQEYVKAQEQAKQEAKQTKQAMAQGDAIVDDMGQVINRNDPRVQNGSIQPNQPPQPPDVSQDPNAQAAMQQLDQQVPDQGLMGQIQQACGGMMKKHDLGGFMDYKVGDANLSGSVDASDKIDKFGNPLTKTAATPGAGAYIGAATTAMDLGMKAFGDTGIDTSGVTATEKTNVGGAALSGAAEGAIAGSQFGPWGAAIGGAAGGIAGGIGAIRGNVDAQKSQVANTFMKASQNSGTKLATGGKLDPIDPDNPLFKSVTTIPQVGATGYTAVPSIGESIYNTTPGDPILNNILKAKPVNYTAPESKTLPSFAGKQFNPTTGILEEIPSKTSQATSGEFMTRPLLNKPGSYFNKEMFMKKPGDKVVDSTSKTDDKKKFDWKKAGEMAAGSGEALRYAPAAMNLYQLAKLKKPEAEGTPRLDTKYKPQYTDENAMMNAIREETNATRGAIREASGGSASDTRASLLAAQLGSMKGLSAASQAGREANAQERRAAQTFDLGVAQQNIAQANLQQDINDKNRGAYDTQKSKLLAALGDTAGAIGKEELYKKYPEMMGLGYSWRGKYNELSDEEKAEALKTANEAKKKIKYSSTGKTTKE